MRVEGIQPAAMGARMGAMGVHFCNQMKSTIRRAARAMARRMKEK